MNNKSVLFYKTLVIGVIILFAGVAVQPGIATVHPEVEIDVEPKDYLFQTIIDLANNPDIKNLLEHNNYQIFTLDYDYKGVFSQILFKKPGLLFGTLFTKPSITYNYLDKCYNKGIEIINIVGEDKALEMIESIKVTDIEVFNELKGVVINNAELSDRIVLLEEMNKEFVSDLSWEFPVICSILYIICSYELITLNFLKQLLSIFEKNRIITIILEAYGAIKGLIGFICLTLLYILECPEWPDI